MESIKNFFSSIFSIDYEYYLGFAYDNFLSICMMAMLIGTGIFVIFKLRALQFRKFGYMM